MILQLTKLRDALASINGLKVYHYWHPRLEAPYCIWAEESEGDSFWSSNHKKEQVITGTIDYYTKQDLDPMVDIIQDRLNQIEPLGWTLNSVIYEDETNLIHYSWDWEIV
jgi:hypothetical protein